MFRLDSLERPFDQSQNLGPNCLNLWNSNLQSVTAHKLFGWLMCNLCHGLCCDMHKAGNGREIRVHKVNQ